jgi:hypothetical protein
MKTFRCQNGHVLNTLHSYRRTATALASVSGASSSASKPREIHADARSRLSMLSEAGFSGSGDRPTANGSRGSS